MNIVDDFTEERFAVEADTSRPKRRTLGVLERLVEIHRLSRSDTMDNGKDLIGKALYALAYELRLVQHHIETGKSQQSM
jgi:hypothetical protein